MHEVGFVSKQGGKLMRALGLMSGTSMDGIDVALIETDGDYELKRGHAATYPYSGAFRAQLADALKDAAALKHRDERPGRLRLLEQYLTELHAEAVTHYLKDHRIAPESIDVIGFHGHTVLHKPEARLTVQLGDGPLLAELTACDVVYDLRAADVAAGGQGAPMAPVYHRALARRIEARPLAFLNIGGVANVTWIGEDGRLIAFDTGPGNAMIDDWVMSRLSKPHDEDGALAALGSVHQDCVAEYLCHPHFSAPLPKSLDRNAFSLAPLAALSTEDGAATLTAFTAESISRSRSQMPEEPKLWVVGGGGRKNKTLMSMIAGRVENAVVPADAVGVDGDSIEAEAWAYLAVRSLNGAVVSFPGTTGVPRLMSGGLVAKAPRR
jgi:anhydro-N-acetylmuramic acid kinase